MAVIIWTPQEDQIILKHVNNKQYKTKTLAFTAAAAEITGLTGLPRSAGAVGQRFSKAKLKSKATSPSKEVAIFKPPIIKSMAMDVAVMAIQKLNPQERLSLVEKMMNDEI